MLEGYLVGDTRQSHRHDNTKKEYIVICGVTSQEEKTINISIDSFSALWLLIYIPT